MPEHFVIYPLLNRIYQTYNQFKGKSALRPRLTYTEHSPVFLKRFGIAVKFVDSSDPAEFAKAIDERTKAIYVESIGNPKYNIAPLTEFAKVVDLRCTSTRAFGLCSSAGGS